jgi:hypothetical protein
MSKGFLDEGKKGNKSAMRAMSFIALIAAIGFGAVVVSTNDPTQIGAYVTFAFLIAAFAPKALQKFAEKELPASPKE